MAKEHLSKNIEGRFALTKWMMDCHYEEIKQSDVAKVEYKIVRLQAILRGYATYKKFRIKPIKGKFDNTITLDEILTNQVVKQARAKAKAFDFEDLPDNILK